MTDIDREKLIKALIRAIGVNEQLGDTKNDAAVIAALGSRDACGMLLIKVYKGDFDKE